MLTSMLQRQRSVVGLCGRCSVGCRAALIRRSTLRAFSLNSSRENDLPQNDVPRADAIAAARSLRELTAADTLYNRLLRLVGNASGAKLPLEASQHASTLIGLLSSRDAVRRRVALFARLSSSSRVVDDDASAASSTSSSSSSPRPYVVLVIARVVECERVGRHPRVNTQPSRPGPRGGVASIDRVSLARVRSVSCPRASARG